MENQLLSYRNSIIHYAVAGAGKKLLICFHGYGRTAQSFQFLASSLQHEYRLLAIDLPFHGTTTWKEGPFFGATDLVAIVNLLLEKERYSGRFQLMGFSLGGRVALRLFQEMPKRIERLMLIAPDGIFVNKWYWFATQTIIGNRIFRYSMQSPQLLQRIVKAGKRLNRVNPGVYKFIDNYIGDDQVRLDLYERWTGLSRMKPDMRKIVSLANANHVPVRFLYGKYDRIIRPAHGEQINAQLADSKLLIADTGHHLLQPSHLPEIRALLKN